MDFFVISNYEPQKAISNTTTLVQGIETLSVIIFV